MGEYNDKYVVVVKYEDIDMDFYLHPDGKLYNQPFFYGYLDAHNLVVRNQSDDILNGKSHLIKYYIYKLSEVF